LKNAADYGTANVGAVVGKVMAEDSSLKMSISKIVPLVKEAVERINKMSPAEIQATMQKYEYVEKVQEERKITLPDAKGLVRTRFAPEPSGYMHIGHAKAGFISYVAAVEYGGEMHMRFDDTNPEKSKQEFVDEMIHYSKWLGIKWNSESYTSDKMELIYDYGRQILKKGKAYVCECSPETIKQNRRERIGCPCRNKPPIQNLREFERMIDGQYKGGERFVRYTGDMSSFNTVMRDPALFRIVEKPHYRQGDKYLVWPIYDFVAPILDSIEGITHAVRSKEYELRDELYEAILNDFDLRKPILIHISRLQIKGNTTQKRVIRKLVEEGKVSGWDDPRLVTIVSLERRGITPEAIKNFVLSFGIGKQESNPDMEKLLVENRKILDPVTKRLFFIKDPVPLEIKGMQKKEIEIPLHPTKDLGKKKVQVEGAVYIGEADADKINEGETIRLLDFANVKIIKKTEGKGIIAEEVQTKEFPEKKMQWVSEDAIKAKVTKPGPLFIGEDEETYNPDSLIVEEGLCERACLDLKEGETIQFVRYGFVRLDDKKGMEFIYSC